MSRPNEILAIVSVFLGILAPMSGLPIIGEPFVAPEFIISSPGRQTPAIPEASTAIPYTPSTAAPKENAYPSPTTYSDYKPESTTITTSLPSTADNIQSTAPTTDVPGLTAAAASTTTTTSTPPEFRTTASPPGVKADVDDSAFEHFSLKPHRKYIFHL